MALETERKYLHPDLALVRERLARGGATFRDCVFEENCVLDTPGRFLRERKMLLRLRRAGKNTLTLKKHPPIATVPGTNVKSLEELETEVEDHAAMLAILENLGFVVAFKYEKIRETWQWQNCSICLDTLPFIEAVEVEGDVDGIEQAASHFGLDGMEASTMTYHQLYQTHRKMMGLTAGDDFVFSSEQKMKIIASATCLSDESSALT